MLNRKKWMTVILATLMLVACKGDGGGGGSESSPSQGGGGSAPDSDGFKDPVGVLDTAFATNGVFHSAKNSPGGVTEAAGSATYVAQILTDGNGKIYLFGNVSTTGPTATYCFVRRLTKGGLSDLSFGVGGLFTTKNPAGGDNCYAGNAGLDSSGRLYGFVAGTLPSSANKRNRIFRLTSTGSLDTTYGTSGFSSAGAESNGKHVRGFVFEDGSTIRLSAPTSSAYSVVEKFTSSGALDTTYGTGGSLVVNFKAAAGGDYLRDGFFDSAGNFFVIGNSDSQMMVKITPNGAIDTSFDGDGQIVWGGISISNAVVQKTKDSIIVMGTRYEASINKHLVSQVRYSAADFTLQTNFGDSGHYAGSEIIANEWSKDSQCFAHLVSPNGKSYQACSTDNGAVESALLVLKKDGKLNTDFFGGTGTLAFTDVSGDSSSDEPSYPSLAFTSDQKLLISFRTTDGGFYLIQMK